jgi:hypothetical protein
MYEHKRGGRAATGLTRHEGVPRQVLPVPGRRGPGIFAALAACLLLASVLILFLQVQGFLGHLEARLTVESGGDRRLNALNQHMEALQVRFNALLAESVEVRLKDLERNIDAGKVGTADLQVFESLKNDLKTLESYAQRNGALGFDYPSREHSRYQAVVAVAPATAAPAPNQVLRSEVLEIRQLLYGLLAALAMALLAAANYWWNQRRNIRRLTLLVAPPLLVSPPSESRR